MEPFVQKTKTYYLIHPWVEQWPDLIAGFTTKHGGNSQGPFQSLNFGFHVGDAPDDVYKNRLLLSEQLNFPLHHWVGAEQVHQAKIEKVTHSNRGKGAIVFEDSIRQTDGLYTSQRGVLLTLVFADCVPLYFFAPKKRLIGMAHAGWRGTVAGIGKEMVLSWQKEGVSLNEILVAIGPSICGNCYIVDDRVILQVQNQLDGVDANIYNLIKDHQYQLNLPELNKLILLDAGIKEEHIIMTKLCTSCHHEQFFSHRKDGGKTGRMMSFIGWKEA
jgi:YfiH family protein